MLQGTCEIFFLSLHLNYNNTLKNNKQELESTRLQKIARLVQKELSEIFRLETAKMGGVLVSVSAVRVSPDLSIARVHLSIFPGDRAQELLANINASEKSIRYELAQRVRYQLRKCPELSFFIDDSLDYIEHIDSLLHPEDKKGGEEPAAKQ